MSTLNEYTIDVLKPKLFYTFDTDQHDNAGQSTQQTNPFIIIDESGFGNHGEFFSYRNDRGESNYKIGEKTLYGLGSELNTSVKFGNDSFDENDLAYAYIKTESDGSLILTSPEFSFNFFYKRGNANKGLINKYREVIFSRANLIDVFSQKDGNNIDYLYIRIYTKTITNTYTSHDVRINNWNIDHNIHINVKQDLNVLTCKVYKNGVLENQFDKNVGTDQLDTSNVANLLIGGTDGDKVSNGVRNTTTASWNMQNLSFFDRELTDLELANILKRSYSYEYLNNRYNYRIPCQDTNIENMTAIHADGGNNFTVIGTVNKMDMLLTPVNKALTSVYFDEKSYLFYSKNNETTKLSVGNNFTISVWINTTTSQTSTFIEMINLVYLNSLPFSIKFNSNNGSYRMGSVEVSDEFGSYANSALDFTINDGKWHFLMVESIGNKIKLYLDGQQHGEYTRKNSTSRSYDRIAIMADLNGNYGVVGNMSYLNIYNGTYTSIEKMVKYLYNNSFIVQGRTTTSGYPTRSNIRIYEHLTNKPLVDIETNQNGEYTAYVPTGLRVLVTMFVLSDTRYPPKSRIVLPTSVDDNERGK